jgi:hypothetical protein
MQEVIIIILPPLIEVRRRGFPTRRFTPTPKGHIFRKIWRWSRGLQDLTAPQKQQRQSLSNSARNSGEISPEWRKKMKLTLQLAIKNGCWGYPVRQIGDRKKKLLVDKSPGAGDRKMKFLRANSPEWRQDN